MRTERVLERLRGDFKGLARIVGIDNVLKISAEFGGLTIRIPKLDGIRPHTAQGLHDPEDEKRLMLAGAGIGEKA